MNKFHYLTAIFSCLIVLFSLFFNLYNNFKSNQILNREYYLIFDLVWDFGIKRPFVVVSALSDEAVDLNLFKKDRKTLIKSHKGL